MLFKKSILFVDYFENWVNLYKKGSVRPVTFRKYEITLARLREIVPDLRLKNLDKAEYQSIINKYSETHEKQTTLDFHHHLKAAISDAIDEGLVKSDPTKRVAIKGKTPGDKKCKYLSLEELKLLLSSLELGDKVSYDWLIYFIAKTGVRFSEALGVTPKDFDFENKIVDINKTWNYKFGGGFIPTDPDFFYVLEIGFVFHHLYMSLEILPNDSTLERGNKGNRLSENRNY